MDGSSLLRRDEEEDFAENADTDSPWMWCLQGSLGVGELQRWAEHGLAEENPEPARGRSLPKPTKGLGAQHVKFNLHAGVSVPGGLPAARERLIRYCARPPLALERLSVLEDGRICYRIKDTDQARLMTPTQFLARLAALVPPPRHPLVRFYGVWAQHSRWRNRVVSPPSDAPSCEHDHCAPAEDSRATDLEPVAPHVEPARLPVPKPAGGLHLLQPSPAAEEPRFERLPRSD